MRFVFITIISFLSLVEQLGKVAQKDNKTPVFALSCLPLTRIKVTNFDKLDSAKTRWI